LNNNNNNNNNNNKNDDEISSDMRSVPDLITLAEKHGQKVRAIAAAV